MNVKKCGDFELVYYNAEWQHPVITEYNVFTLLHATNKLPYNYFAFPWATFIDMLILKLQKDSGIKRVLDTFKSDKPYCTVVQHIRFIRLFELFKSLQICHVFTPHCTLADKALANTYGIELYGFPLYAKVKKTLADPFIPVAHRRYLTAFIGHFAYRTYLTDIRTDIFKLFYTYSDCVIKYREDWHYQGVVYNLDTSTNRELEDDFKMTLAQSKFSLCPSGTGPNSIRIWEAMSFGSIPVILADTLVLPTIRTMNWSDAVIFWKEAEVDKLYAYLKSISNAEMESRSKACLELFATYFSDEAFCRVLFETKYA